jgi:hypothetical protein
MGAGEPALFIDGKFASTIPGEGKNHRSHSALKPKRSEREAARFKETPPIRPKPAPLPPVTVL